MLSDSVASARALESIDQDLIGSMEKKKQAESF